MPARPQRPPQQAPGVGSSKAEALQDLDIRASDTARPGCWRGSGQAAARRRVEGLSALGKEARQKVRIEAGIRMGEEQAR